MSKCEGEAARQHVSQVTPPAASDVREAISLRKSKVIFFFFVVLLHNELSHLRMPAEQKKSREGPHSPVTGNVQCVSEKLARASLVSAFNV